jgi:hypothetical protein
MTDRYRVEKGDWHSHQFRVTNGVKCVRSFRSGNSVQLANAVTLTVFRDQVDLTTILLIERPKTTI